MKLPEQLIEIFEEEVYHQFINLHRLAITLTELACENIENDIFYQQSKISQINTDYINQIFLHPIILSTYSSFESLLKQLCQLIETDFDFQESNTPFPGYKLKDLGKFLSEDLEKDWHTVITYNRLRNIIAHFNGNYESIPSDDRNKYQKVVKIDLLELSPNGTIILNDKFPKIYIDFFHSFFTKLIQQIKHYESQQEL